MGEECVQRLEYLGTIWEKTVIEINETEKLSKFTISDRLGKISNSLDFVFEGADAMMIQYNDPG